MSKKALHTTIKQVLSQQGQEILSDLRLMYILSDYGAFDRLTDEHDIVRDLQTQGFGKLILDCKQTADADWQAKVNAFLNEFLVSHSGYDSAEVIYISDALAYGADLLPESSIRKSGGLPPSPSVADPIDYAAELQKLKNEYLALLKSGIVVPQGKLFKKPSGYYPIDIQNKLYLLEQKICLLGQELGQDLQKWCADEKMKVLDDNHFPVDSQRIGLIAVIGIPAIVAIILLVNLFSFISEKDAVDSFKINMATADSLYQHNQYEAAINAYRFAGDSYTSSYKPSKYKGKANDGIQKASIALVNSYLTKVKPYYDSKDYYEAQKVLAGMPKSVDCSSDARLSKQLKDLQEEIASNSDLRMSLEIDEFIKTISKGKGKPSKEVLERVDYLLSVDSTNYWLKFIKAKSSK